jgi:hypothetical protein
MSMPSGGVRGAAALLNLAYFVVEFLVAVRT